MNVLLKGARVRCRRKIKKQIIRIVINNEE